MASPGRQAFRGEGELWDLKDQYLAWMESTGYAELSIKGAHADLSFFLRHTKKLEVDRIADITPDVLEEYSLSLRIPKNELMPSPRHISRRLVSVRQFFQWLAKNALILYDPSEDLERPKLPSNLPHTILTQEEARKFLDAPDLGSPIGYRDRALLEILYAAGPRSTELMRIKVEDVDFKHRAVWIIKGKGRKDRVIPVPALPLEYVREYIDKVRPVFARRQKKDEGFLFLTHTGKRFTPNTLGEIFKRNRKRAGLSKHVTALTMRHSLGSHLLENGMGIRYIQKILGHEKLSTSTIYCKVTLQGLKKWFAKMHPKEKRARRKG